jgi:DNA-binding transcriptional MerR regulator
MLLKIGAFAKLSRVSTRMLRHYDKIGLLKPIHADPITGYRFYSLDQLPWGPGSTMTIVTVVTTNFII